MIKWKVTLDLELEEGDPNEWDWYEILALTGNEIVWVEAKEESK